MSDSTELEDKLLAQMGLEGLEGERKYEALQNILFTLNINVGRRMLESFTDEQAEEFERLSRPDADTEKLAYWIALNVPDHQQIIEEEAEKLRGDTEDFVDRMMKKADGEPAAENLTTNKEVR